MTQPFVIETHAEEETEAIGVALWPLLAQGGVVALHGELAAGKTCLVRGMARAAGVTGNVHSPTFTLVNQYEAAPPIYHLDLYRLESPEQLYDLGWEDWRDSGVVVAVEWPDRAEALLPKKHVEIRLSHAPPRARRIEIVDHGVLCADWRDHLSAASAR